MLKLTFFVPAEYKETVKLAVFAAGAGRIGNYQHCSWEVLGDGQFRALPGATPFIGKEGELEVVEEYKVEMVCEKEKIHQVLDALKQAHPYEEPAYDVIELLVF